MSKKHKHPQHYFSVEAPKVARWVVVPTPVLGGGIPDNITDEKTLAHWRKTIDEFWQVQSEIEQRYLSACAEAGVIPNPPTPLSQAAPSVGYETPLLMETK